MSECLFSKDELKPQKAFEREFDFASKKMIARKIGDKKGFKEPQVPLIIKALQAKRDELNAKGDFISMGCAYKVYLANKDEIDKECQRRNMSKKSEILTYQKNVLKNSKKNNIKGER